MTPSTARHILELLLSGVHPVTGDDLPRDHVCAEPAVIRALHQAIMALQDSAVHPSPPAGAACENRPWTREDDKKLRLLFRHNLPAEVIAQTLDRRTDDVMKRLSFLRLTPAASGSSPDHSGAPWYLEDDEKLTELYEARAPLEEIAAFFKRSENAIQHRMANLGLIERRGQYTGGVRPWKQSDTALLIAMFHKNQSISSMARHFECTEQAIKARLFYLGLSPEAPQVLPGKKNSEP